MRESEVARRRAHTPVAAVLPALRQWLSEASRETGQALIVADDRGHVLWREGTSAVMRFADRLGFVEGSYWVEENVGTNAIGTALVLGEPVHIHGKEHFVDSHREWTCAAAPIIDPILGTPIGVIDLSGPTRTWHPHTRALVALAARTASAQLKAEHDRAIERLRVLSAPILARLREPALAVSPQGIIAAAVGCLPSARLALPERMDTGFLHVPGFGHVRAEPIPGGWLLRRRASADGAGTSAHLDLTRDPATLRIDSPVGSWLHELTPRHAQILTELALHPAGRSAADLARSLFCDPSRTITVRAEISRLRRIVGPLLESRPYRLSRHVTCRGARDETTTVKDP